MKAAKRSVEIKAKCWTELNGEKFLGPGNIGLLKTIAEHGSITRAAQSMGMSYKKAWAMIDEMNKLAKSPLVITNKGGSNGGGTEITEGGKKEIAAYDKINKKILSIIKSESILLML